MIVFIPSAGRGTRVKNYTKSLNKALIKYKDKAIISHIIDYYPKEYEFVIGLGHEGQKLKDYIKLAHPDKNLKFYFVSDYKTKYSGLSLTIKEGMRYLNKPFIFHANDTYVEGKFSKLKIYKDKNVILVNKNTNYRDYRSVTIDSSNNITDVHDKENKKVRTKNRYSYVGIMCVNDYKVFKNIIKKSYNEDGEFKFIEEYNSFINAKVVNNWIDFGSKNTLEKIIKKDPYLEKNDEEIFFNNNIVLKYDNDSNKIKNRIIRSKYLKKFIPKDIKYLNNFLSYKFIRGELLSQDYSKFKEFIIWAEKNLWKRIKLKSKEKINFQNDCKEFYKDKTFKRVKIYSNKLMKLDKIKNINNRKINGINFMLNKVKWNKISMGIASMNHGDLHGSNIIFNGKNFYLLDWRESFNNNVRYGDIYYDLAKIKHGLIVNHEYVQKDKFELKINRNLAKISIPQNLKMTDAINFYDRYLEINNYSSYNVDFLTSLIFINIAPLHQGRYSEFLFLLGKYKLSECLEKYA